MALMTWARYQPLLRDLYHIPNGGLRNKIVAMKLKAMGAKAGVSDLHLPLPILHRPLLDGESLGLWLEMKTEKGDMTEKQEDWHQHMRAAGYGVATAYGLEEARQILAEYMDRYRNAAKIRESV